MGHYSYEKAHLGQGQFHHWMEHWVLCPSPSHDITLSVLSISLLLFAGPGVSGTTSSSFCSSQSFLRGQTSSSGLFSGLQLSSTRAIRKGDAAEPNPRRAAALLSEHRCHSEDGMDCFSPHIIQRTLHLSHTYSIYNKCLDSSQVSTGYIADKRKELQCVPWRCL